VPVVMIEIRVKDFANALKRDLKNIESYRHFSNTDNVSKIVEFANIYLSKMEEQSAEYWTVDDMPYTVEMFDADVEMFMSSNGWDSTYYSLYGNTCKAGKGFYGIFTNVYTLIS
jgi:hypothetical protein